MILLLLLTDVSHKKRSSAKRTEQFKHSSPSRVAIAGLCVAVILSCLGSANCREFASYDVRLSVHAMLIGGSKGLPSHLSGDLHVRADAVDFEAYPQIYNVSWSCNDLRQIGALVRKNQTVALSSAIGVHRFDLLNTNAARQFENEVQSICK